MSNRAVIFDVDGTIVDSVDLHAEAWRSAFGYFGRIISIDTIKRQIGKGADQLLPVFFTREELNLFGCDLDQYRSELFQRDFLPKLKAFARVRELFERIKDDGRKIALASSAKESELDAYKTIAHIDDLVDAETSADNVEQSKPCADVFQSALSKLGACQSKMWLRSAILPTMRKPRVKKIFPRSPSRAESGMPSSCTRPAASQYIAIRRTC
jgi:beta-phosphoglucomutase-like phosphatase (HAD superfamily)